MARKAEQNLNTTKTVNNSNLSEVKAAREIEKAKRILKGHKKVPVMIPKQLADSLGSVVNLSINGVPCPVPVDGKTYEIPEPFLLVLKERMQTTQAADIEVEANPEIHK